MPHLLRRLRQRGGKLEHEASLEQGTAWEIQFAEDAARHAALKPRLSRFVTLIPKDRRDIARRQIFPLNVVEVTQFAGEERLILREIIWI
jgi:hypothetical protein